MKDSILSLFTLTLENLAIAEIYNYQMKVQSENAKEKIEESPISLIPTNFLSINHSSNPQTPNREELKSIKTPNKTKVENNEAKNDEDFIFITPNMKKFNSHKKHKKSKQPLDEKEMKNRRVKAELVNFIQLNGKGRRRRQF